MPLLIKNGEIVTPSQRFHADIYCEGEVITRIDRNLANFLPEPGQKAQLGTTPCRSYPPNGYGLFDMIGNVWEWVQDWYDAAYYSTTPSRNPEGPGQGSLRLVRGGAWLVGDVRMLSCSHRHKVPVDTYSYTIGFRVACSA